METKTLNYTRSYTDTEAHILFAAKFYGYKDKQAAGGLEIDASGMFAPKMVDNPQSPEDFMIEKIDAIIKDFMTKPIQAYIKEEAIKQAEITAKQAAEVVLNKIS